MIIAPQRAQHPRAYTQAANGWERVRKLAHGTALASVLAIAATSVSTLHGGPLALIVIETLWIALFVLGVIAVLH